MTGSRIAVKKALFQRRLSGQRRSSPANAAAPELARLDEAYPRERLRSLVRNGGLETPTDTAEQDKVAQYLDMPPIAVYEVATFYSMYELKPVGRHKVCVCTNVSCMLRGAEELVSHIEGRLGIRIGESTADGRIFLKQEEECLAACCGAPMMMVDHRYHENLTVEDVDRILDELDQEHG